MGEEVTQTDLLQKLTAYAERMDSERYCAEATQLLLDYINDDQVSDVFFWRGVEPTALLPQVTRISVGVRCDTYDGQRAVREFHDQLVEFLKSTDRTTPSVGEEVKLTFDEAVEKIAVESYCIDAAEMMIPREDAIRIWASRKGTQDRYRREHDVVAFLIAARKLGLLNKDRLDWAK